jgi:hypothetical protein
MSLASYTDYDPLYQDEEGVGILGLRKDLWDKVKLQFAAEKGYKTEEELAASQYFGEIPNPYWSARTAIRLLSDFAGDYPSWILYYRVPWYGFAAFVWSWRFGDTWEGWSRALDGEKTVQGGDGTEAAVGVRVFQNGAIWDAWKKFALIWVLPFNLFILAFPLALSYLFVVGRKK